MLAAKHNAWRYALSMAKLDFSMAGEIRFEAMAKAKGRDKDPHAVHLGQLGGKARSRKLSAEERIAIAQRAARARWSKVKRKAQKTNE